jgi:T-complex protein 1 subunit beta
MLLYILIYIYVLLYLCAYRPDLVTLGECDLIDELVVGEDRLIRFSGCKSGKACTLILRGASSHLLDEAERSMHDALCVLTETVKETRVICGGGCTEMLMANAIDLVVPTVQGKAALAMEGFARALRQLPTIIADNAGLDSSELVSVMRAKHAQGETNCGINILDGTVGNMWELGIRESFKSKLQVLFICINIRYWSV